MPRTARTIAPITDYSVRYMLKGGPWADQTHEGVMTETMIDGLVNGAEYEVQVAAVNKNGMGDYSESAMGTPMMMDEEDPMETPALPLFGAFALGAGLLAAESGALCAAGELRAARVQGQLGSLVRKLRDSRSCAAKRPNARGGTPAVFFWMERACRSRRG